MKMIDTHFKSEQNQFLHLDTEEILSAPLYILLGINRYKQSPIASYIYVNLFLSTVQEPSTQHKLLDVLNIHFQIIENLQKIPYTYQDMLYFLLQNGDSFMCCVFLLIFLLIRQFFVENMQLHLFIARSITFSIELFQCVSFNKTFQNISLFKEML